MTAPGKCAVCGEPSRRLDAAYVLLPADDVPLSGSRTEVIISPSGCLRVRVHACRAGHLTLHAAGPIPEE